MTVLETSYIVTLLRPHFRNYGKRLVKTPKLYFLYSGLAAWLMGIRDAQTLETHAAQEIDVLCETTQGLQAIEVKSGSTYACDWAQGLEKWQSLAGAEYLDPTIIYGGANSFEREGINVWSWKDVVQASPLPRIS
jgi:hypothetical protein